jgi:hypothetical protein
MSIWPPAFFRDQRDEWTQWGSCSSRNLSDLYSRDPVSETLGVFRIPDNGQVQKPNKP